MEKIMILNGSPRAPRSNSKRYAAYVAKYSPWPTEYFEIRKNNHAQLRERMAESSDLVLVFPLYADSLPVGVLNLLKSLEVTPPERRPVISVVVNCGFLEPDQNEIAVRILRFFCRKNGYEFGSVLMAGSGEAILDTPFRVLVARKIRRLMRSIVRRRYEQLRVTMPIGKRLFLMASTLYWTRYGKRFGVTRQQMQTPRIEE